MNIRTPTSSLPDGAEIDNVRHLRQSVRPKTLFGRRWRVAWRAELEFMGRREICMVEDVSDGGAKLRIGLARGIGESALLLVSGFRPLTARIVWGRLDRLGIQFDDGQPWTTTLARIAAMGAKGQQGSGRG